MGKYQKAIPAKTASNLTVLAARFDDQGNPKEVKWFTEKGFTLIPDDLNYTKGGGKVRVKNGGWVRVKPEDFEGPPSPLEAKQVTGDGKIPDPNAIPVVTASDPVISETKKEEADGVKAEPGVTNESGDKSKEKTSGKETAKADPKPEKSK